MPRRTLVTDPPYIPCLSVFKLDFASFKQAINPFLFLNNFPDFDPLDPF
jgi:hypothetical protein